MNIHGRGSAAEIFSGLNPEQAEAVRTTSGPLLVLAGAGTGKTFVLTRRIAYLIHNRVASENILAVTFTRRAAAEMRDRLEPFVGRGTGRPAITTFHGLGLRMLREHGHRIDLPRAIEVLGTENQLKIVGDILDEVDPEGEFSAINVLTRISFAKNRRVTPDAVDGRELDEASRKAALVYSRYEKELRARGLLDFDDLLSIPLKLLSADTRIQNYYRRRFRYILVDEYQDTNRMQYELTRQLVNDDQNLCVVGDDDQSIYRFRGAELGNILGFEQDFPGAKVIALERNYRCKEPIISLANAVIAGAKRRYEKRLIATLGPGVPVRLKQVRDERGEATFIVTEIRRCAAAGIPHSSIAIIHRVKSQLRGIEDQLKQQAIPCGHSSGGVTTMTLHQAKGLEFRVVFLPSLEEDMLPHFHAIREGDEAVEEERRLFYVGVTRAQQELLITCAESRAGHERQPSRFIKELAETGVLHVE